MYGPPVGEDLPLGRLVPAGHGLDEGGFASAIATLVLSEVMWWSP